MSFQGCCARLRSSKTSEDVWSPLWLRFHDGQQEAGFLKAQKPLLVRRVQVITGIGHIMTTCGILMTIVDYQPWNPERFSSELRREVSDLTIVISVVMLFYVSVVLAFVCCRRLTDRSNSAVIEVVCILSAVIVMVVGVLSSSANITAFKGVEVSEVLPCSSDSRILLLIDGMVTAVHLGVPIRWFVMLPLEVASILLYGVVILIGGSEDAPYLNFAWLAGLVIVSSLGKRHAELGDRHAFLKLIREKQLRCQAEFQLSQFGPADGNAQELGLANGAMLVPAEARSAAPTSKSGTAFSPDDQTLSVQAKMARIAEIGRAEHWLIGSRYIKLLPKEVLGHGAFGIVIKAIMSGILVAVKLPKAQLGEVNLSRYRDICNEMRVLRHVRHPNIVSFHGAVIDPLGRKLAIVLEYVQGVLLDRFIGKGKRNDEGALVPATTLDRFQVLLGTCSALLHMHTIKPVVVHSDLKTSNIMVECFGSEVRPKLLDFGLASVVSESAPKRPRGGTPTWMAPEAASGRGAAKPSMDVYSFGHMINFVSVGVRPPRFTQMQLRSGELPRRPEGSLLEPVLGLLADDCLSYAAASRPSMGQVYQRLLAVPEHVQLASASKHFLKSLHTLAEGLQSVSHLSVEPCSHLLSDEEPPVEALGSESSARALGMNLPTLRSDTTVVEEEAETNVPDSPPPRSSHWRPCPLLPTTKENAMLSTLLSLAATWNPAHKKQPCCELHGAVKVIKNLLSNFADADCTSRALNRPPHHCPECGLLAREPGRCVFCSQTLSSEPALTLSTQQTPSAAALVAL